MLTEPVAEIIGKRRSAASGAPTAWRSPIARFQIGGASFAARTCCAIRVTAIAESGACSEGFQSVESPQTAAIIAFQAQTATGKLKAVMTPTGPSGCHCSYMRCRGRSECIDRP